MVVMFVGIFFAIMGWTVFRRSQAKKAWSSLAGRHDMQFFDGGWFGEFGLSGTYRGVDVEVKTETRGSGKNKKTYTVYQASLPGGVPFGLIVYDEGFFSQVGKLFGGQDIEIGHPEVDDAFIIKSDHPAEVHRFFDDRRVRQAFLRLAASGQDIHVEHGQVEIDERGLETSIDDLRRNLDLVVHFSQDLAESFEETELDAIEDSQPVSSGPPEEFEDIPGEEFGAVEQEEQPAGERSEDEEYVQEW